MTAASSNGAFVRLGQVVGLKNVVDMARKLGVTSYLDPSVLTMPLGTFLTTPIEMASAYSTIPNNGVHVPAYFIDKIEDRNGNTIFEHEVKGNREISEKTACLATEMLKNNVLYGTATRAKLSQQDAAGKTGTTEKNYDAWFVGFTPYLTTAVWMGNPDLNVSMANLNGVANFGGTYPAMIWRAYNEAVHANLPVVPFPTCPPPDRGPRNVLGQGNIFANGGFVAPKPEPFLVLPDTGTTDPGVPPADTPTTTAPPVSVPVVPGGGGGGGHRN